MSQLFETTTAAQMFARRYLMELIDELSKSLEEKSLVRTTFTDDYSNFEYINGDNIVIHSYKTLIIESGRISTRKKTKINKDKLTKNWVKNRLDFRFKPIKEGILNCGLQETKEIRKKINEAFVITGIYKSEEERTITIHGSVLDTNLYVNIKNSIYTFSIQFRGKTEDIDVLNKAIEVLYLITK